MRTLPKMTAAKHIAHFVAAPVIGLAYAMFFPFVALGLLAWIGGAELAHMKVAKFVAAPFIGLAAIVLMPFAGIATMAWIAMGGELPHMLVSKLAIV